jgi:hypothetical protein
MLEGSEATIQSWSSSPGLLNLDLVVIPTPAPLPTQAKGTQRDLVLQGMSLVGNQAGSRQPPDLHPHPTVHLWRFSGGYPALMDCMNKLKNNKV